MTDVTIVHLDAADTLTGVRDITWRESRTVATTEHKRENPTAPAEVRHTATFDVEPMFLPKVLLEYGSVHFWPEMVEVEWIDGELRSVNVEGHQATKAGLGKDTRSRTFGKWGRWVKRENIPAKLRAAIEHYEGRVPVASPSPVVVE